MTVEPNKETESTETQPEIKTGPVQVGAVDAASEALASKTSPDAETAEGSEGTENTESSTEPEVEYAEYDDENAAAAVTLMKEAGLKASEARKFFAEAVASRDISKIDVAGLEKSVGKDKAKLIVLAMNQYYNTALAETNDKVNAVISEVGSDKNWVQVRDWAAELAKTDTAFAKKVKEFNQMFDLNPQSAKMAATELKRLYEADPKNKSLTVNMVQGDKTGSTDDTSTQITRSEYLEKMKAAQAENDVQEIERLRALRLASKQAGI